MNNHLLKNSIRFILFILVQTVVLQQVRLGGDSLNYISLFIYPLFLFLLPLKTSKISLVLLGFCIGIIIDISYNSLGVHAAASLFTAILRPAALAIFEPREGYNVNLGLTVRSYGFLWFLKYAGVLLFFHLFFYFALELFSPVYLAEIFLRTILSFVFSMILIFVYIFLFRPKN
jgi:hypothetical protein